MQKKRFYLILIAMLLLALSMTQCTGGTEETAVPEPDTPAEPAQDEPAEPAEEPVEEAQPFAGTELVLASMTDQYIAAFRALIPQFEEETGIKVTMDELGYVDLYQKLTADFVAETGNYDLMTVDIVWSGEYAANGYTLPLDDFMARDEAELDLDDIMPVSWTLGEYEGKQWAYPLAGYANVLNYRKDILAEAGIDPPTTQEELLAAAQALTDADNDFYGMALLGAKGSAISLYVSAIVFTLLLTITAIFKNRKTKEELELV